MVASCYFGSPHQKECRLLFNHIDAANVDVRCTRDHPHVRIEGKFTKPSAVYVPGVALHFASDFEML